VVGSAISPVIKICANPETGRKLAGDMDIDAGRIMEGRGTLDEVGPRSTTWCWPSPAAQRSVSEALGHQEFILTYKAFDPIGPACLPLRRAS
jgi:altronate dehydratase large subunit